MVNFSFYVAAASHTDQPQHSNWLVCSQNRRYGLHKSCAGVPREVLLQVSSTCRHLEVFVLNNVGCGSINLLKELPDIREHAAHCINVLQGPADITTCPVLQRVTPPGTDCSVHYDIISKQKNCVSYSLPYPDVFPCISLRY